MGLGSMGGGFFGSGAKRSESFGGAMGKADNQANNNAGGYIGAPVINLADNRQASGKYASNNGEAMALSLNMTDHGAIGAALDFANGALTGVGNALGSLFDAGNSIVGKGAQQNIEFLGAVDRWTETNAMVQLEQARIAEQQAARAMAEVSAANSRSLTFAEGVTNTAMDGILANTTHSTNLLAEYQNAALEQVAHFGQQSQDASLNALDYVFESSKSETARLSEMSTKWAIGAAVLVAGMLVWAGAKR